MTNKASGTWYHNKMYFGYFIRYAIDVLLRPKYVSAVFAVIVIQHRSTILNFFRDAITDGIIQTSINLILYLADVARGCYYAFNEFIRSFWRKYVISFMDESDGRNYSRYPLIQKEPNHLQSNDSNNLPSHNNDNNQQTSFGPLPPLVVVKNSEGPTIALKTGVSRTAVTNETKSETMKPLQPAFLKKENYPPGWLVYHPVLGISSVKEADDYDEQTSSTLMQKEMHHHDHIAKKEESQSLNT